MLATRMRMSSGGVSKLLGDVPVGATLFGADGSVLVALASAETAYEFPDTGLLVFRTAGDYGTINMPKGLEVTYLAVAAGGRGGSGTYWNLSDYHGGRAGGGLQTAEFTGTHILTATMAFTVGAANNGNTIFKGTTYTGGISGGNASTGHGADRAAGSTQTFLGYTYGGRLDRRGSRGTGAAATVWGMGGQPGWGEQAANRAGGNGYQGIILLHWGSFSMNYSPVTNTCS